MTSEVYANVVEHWNVDEEIQIDDLATIENCTFQYMHGVINQAFSKYVDFTYFNYCGHSYDNGGNICFYPQNTVCVLVDVGDARYYKLRAYKLVDDVLVEFEYSKLGTHYNSIGGYARIFPPDTSTEYYFTDEGLEYYGYDQECTQPIASSEENALLYLQTGDISYLYNFEDLVDVSMVNNFSIYKASEENNAYLYYENSTGFTDLSINVIDDGSMNTIIEYKYIYYDAAGDVVDITDFEVVTLDYYRRNQYAISLEPINNFDTGCITGYIYNYWQVGGESNSINFTYDPNKDNYGYFVLDPDGNKVGVSLENDAVIQKDALDFITKNDSYTGADVSDGVDTSFLSGDFSFLGFIFSGFGLLGENGLIALMGKTFEFMPPEFVILIGSGIVAVIILCFVKILMK